MTAVRNEILNEQDARSGNSTTPASTATTLRRMLEDIAGDIIICPGVYDGLSARIALEVGFKVLYMV
jgi:2-methylisocitrate lyase-like PEP mutase family enzyme